MLLPGLLVTTATLVVPVVNVALLVTFVVDVAFMVHVLHEAQISFHDVAFFGFWCYTLHTFRSYFHLAYSQEAEVVVPRWRLHG